MALHILKIRSMPLLHFSFVRLLRQSVQIESSCDRLHVRHMLFVAKIIEKMHKEMNEKYVCCKSNEEEEENEYKKNRSISVRLFKICI